MICCISFLAARGAGLALAAAPAGLPRAALLLPGLLHRDAGRLLPGVLAPGVRHEGGPGQVLQLHLPPPILVRLVGLLTGELRENTYKNWK